MVDYGFNGKTAIVTGAAGGGGGGTGFAIAKLFAENGANVVMGDINPAGDAAAESLRQAGLQAFFCPMDLADEASVKEIIRQAAAEYGRIDILVNCGYFQAPEGQLMDTPIDLWDKHFAVNVRGNYLMIRYCLPHMIQGGGGVIVNISSTASIRGEDGAAAYGACKAALNALTRSVAAQYGDRNIRCNAVLPGSILNERTLAYAATVPAMQFQFDSLKRHTLNGRYGNAEDIANLTAFLASDKAGNITGQCIVCDGGYTAQSSMWSEIHEYKKNHDWGII